MEQAISIKEFKEFAKLGKLKRTNPKEYKQMIEDVTTVFKDVFKILVSSLKGIENID